MNAPDIVFTSTLPVIVPSKAPLLLVIIHFPLYDPEQVLIFNIPLRCVCRSNPEIGVSPLFSVPETVSWMCMIPFSGISWFSRLTFRFSRIIVSVNSVLSFFGILGLEPLVIGAAVADSMNISMIRRISNDVFFDINEVNFVLNLNTLLSDMD